MIAIVPRGVWHRARFSHGLARPGIAPGIHPRIFQWLDTIHARPAFQAALAKGGPYSYA